MGAAAKRLRKSVRSFKNDSGEVLSFKRTKAYFRVEREFDRQDTFLMSDEEAEKYALKVERCAIHNAKYKGWKSKGNKLNVDRDKHGDGLRPLERDILDLMFIGGAFTITQLAQALFNIELVPDEGHNSKRTIMNSLRKPVEYGYIVKRTHCVCMRGKVMQSKYMLSALYRKQMKAQLNKTP